MRSNFIWKHLTQLDPNKNGYQNQFFFCRNDFQPIRVGTRSSRNGFQPYQVGTRTSRRSYNAISNVWWHIPNIYFLNKTYNVWCSFQTLFLNVKSFDAHSERMFFMFDIVWYTYCINKLFLYDILHFKFPSYHICSDQLTKWCS